MFYPMANMELEGLSFAVLSLDEGIETPHLSRICKAKPAASKAMRWNGEGVRAVMFLDAGAWNVGSAPLSLVGLVGLALIGVAGFMPRKKSVVS